jgi:hypothetical protein
MDTRKPGTYKYGSEVFDFEPFYIGKGRGARRFTTKYSDGNTIKARIIAKIHALGLKVRGRFVRTNLTEADAFELERKWIAKIGRRNLDKGPLANLTDGGDGVSGYKFDREVVERLRQQKIGKKQDPGVVAKRVAKLRGKKRTPEQCEAISERMKGRKASIDTRVLLSLSHMGHKQSEETKAKRAAKHRGMKRPPETGKRIAAALKGRKASDSHREAISKALSGRTLSDEHRQRIREGMAKSKANKKRIAKLQGRI